MENEGGRRRGGEGERECAGKKSLALATEWATFESK